MYYRGIVNALGHTPLVELPHLSSKDGVRILAKVEGQSVGGSASVKDRIARYMVESAEKSGELTPGRVILEATSGNTGIALAWIGRSKGYKVCIVMPESMSVERRQLLKIFGAELILTPGDLGMQGAIDTVYKMAAEDKKYYLADQFTNLANPQAHYETTGVEIIDDFPYDKIDYLVAGLGTGGSITGISRRLKEKYPDIRVIGVEPPADDPIQGLRCMNETNMPPVLDLSLITERLHVTSKEAEVATLRLLHEEGIFAGLSSGAALRQALKIAAQINRGNIVVVLPDGGWKYLSLDMWTGKS